MVANNDSKMRECPFCKEEILTEAIKCKHCGSAVSAETPAHKGTCPFCKEKINPEAIKCKHCKSMLGQAEHSQQGHSGCGCGKSTQESVVGSLALRVPSFPGQESVGRGGVFTPPQFGCNPLFCRCTGDSDCNDMFGSGICKGRSICYETSGGGTTCFCLR